jgi:acyl-CoA dehydrogenase
VDFELTESARAIRDGLRELVARFDLDYWRECEAKHAFPEEYFAALAAGGWLGIAIPKEYGGAGLGMVEMALAVDELARGGGGTVPLFIYNLSPVFGAMPITRHGTEEQKARWLPGLASGEIEFSMALTEPGAGTNTLATETTARRKGDGWVLSGQKVFISGVARAKGMLVIARTSPPEPQRPGTEGMTTFLIDPHHELVSFQPIEKVGTNLFDTNFVFFDDVPLPTDALLGEEGNGWQCILDTLNPERIVTTAGAVGAGDLVIELAGRYARERVVFDRPIASYQGLQFPLARAKAELEMARLANLKAAWTFDRGQNPGSLANMAKLVGTEWACIAADQAMQTLGGYGYTADYHIERYWRDLRLLKIAPVTQEMTLNYIAQHALKLPRSY